MCKIVQYCNEALSYGACRMRFTNLLNQGAAHELDNGLFLDSSDINQVLEAINSARTMYRKEVFYIERCGSFGPFPKSHFHCPAGTNTVFLTPDFKVYPCLFLAKPGYEIGFYKNGAIYIYDGYNNDGNYCLALNVLNHHQ